VSVSKIFCCQKLENQESKLKILHREAGDLFKMFNYLKPRAENGDSFRCHQVARSQSEHMSVQCHTTPQTLSSLSVLGQSMCMGSNNAVDIIIGPERTLLRREMFSLRQNIGT
jgi:hypothetical protein